MNANELRTYDLALASALVSHGYSIAEIEKTQYGGRSSFIFERTDKLDDLDVSNKIYFDVVFNPIDTPLLNYFKDRGALTVDGLWMMIHQGVAALETWLDKEIEIDEQDLERIHNKLLKELQNV